MPVPNITVHGESENSNSLGGYNCLCRNGIWLVVGGEWRCSTGARETHRPSDEEIRRLTRRARWYAFVSGLCLDPLFGDSKWSRKYDAVSRKRLDLVIDQIAYDMALRMQQ